MKDSGETASDNSWTLSELGFGKGLPTKTSDDFSVLWLGLDKFLESFGSPLVYEYKASSSSVACAPLFESNNKPTSKDHLVQHTPSYEVVVLSNGGGSIVTISVPGPLSKNFPLY